MGNIAKDRNPSKLVAQPIPNFSYTTNIRIAYGQIEWILLWTVNKGKVPPKMYRSKPLAAIADAAVSAAYVSIM